MSARPPEGLRLLGLAAAIFACLMVLGVVIPKWTVMGGVAGMMGVLALVAAEALWNGRPWAFRASVALAVGFYIALVVVLTIVPHAAVGAGVAMGLSIGGLIPALLYIRRQVASLAQTSGQTRIAVPGRMP